jgi:hypothetical protein
MNSFTKIFYNTLDAIQSMLMSVLTKIGPFTVALMPASFTAYAIYHTFEESAGHTLALFFALIVGGAWETVGIVACHTAIDLYNAAEDKLIQPVKFWVMLGLIPVYVIGVALVVYFSGDAFVPLVKGLGVASPFLTTITYTAVGLLRDIKRIEAQQASVEDRQAEIEAEQRRIEHEREAEALAWQREKERLEMEQKHAEKLARIDAKRSSPRSIERSSSVQIEQPEAFKGSQLDVLNVQKARDKEQNLNAVLDYLNDNPDASLNDIKQFIGVNSKSTALNYVNELQEAGRLVKNGHGWEVTG